VRLHLSHVYKQPLPPGVLPSTLRRLVLGCRFNKRLEAGSLPHGLEVVQFSVEYTHRADAWCSSSSIWRRAGAMSSLLIAPTCPTTYGGFRLTAPAEQGFARFCLRLSRLIESPRPPP
jgi:FNIP Repeat